MPNLTIRLPEEKLKRLREAASARKTSADALVEDAIDAFLAPVTGASLADALHDYIGAIDGPPTDSSKMSEIFGEILERKHREGHL